MPAIFHNTITMRFLIPLRATSGAVKPVNTSKFLPSKVRLMGIRSIIKRSHINKPATSLKLCRKTMPVGGTRLTNFTKFREKNKELTSKRGKPDRIHLPYAISLKYLPIGVTTKMSTITIQKSSRPAICTNTFILCLAPVV